jgi:hypothetical protein
MKYAALDTGVYGEDGLLIVVRPLPNTIELEMVKDEEDGDMFEQMPFAAYSEVFDTDFKYTDELLVTMSFVPIISESYIELKSEVSKFIQNLHNEECYFKFCITQSETVQAIDEAIDYMVDFK